MPTYELIPPRAVTNKQKDGKPHEIEAIADFVELTAVWLVDGKQCRAQTKITVRDE